MNGKCVHFFGFCAICSTKCAYCIDGECIKNGIIEQKELRPAPFVINREYDDIRYLV